MFYGILSLVAHYNLRAGIADGWEFEIRPPGTAACFFDKDNNKY